MSWPTSPVLWSVTATVKLTGVVSTLETFALRSTTWFRARLRTRILARVILVDLWFVSLTVWLSLCSWVWCLMVMLVDTLGRLFMLGLVIMLIGLLDILRLLIFSILGWKIFEWKENL